MSDLLAGLVVKNLSELEALALALAGEARGETYDGQVAVGQVILNRRLRGTWGSTVNDVVTAPKQFSCFWPQLGRENHEYVLRLAHMLERGEEPLDFAYKQCEWIAEGLLARVLTRDLVGGATHYLTRALYDTGKVTWASTMRVTAEVGAHIFGIAR